MRRPSLTPAQIALLLTVVSFLGGITANIAAGALPEAWEPYLWLAWPITGLVLALTIGLTIAAQRSPPDLHRQRALLLGKVAARVTRALDDRLPGRARRIALDLARQLGPVIPRPRLDERVKGAPGVGYTPRPATFRPNTPYGRAP